MSDRISVIKSLNPATVCKSFKRGDDGELKKTSIAHITEGKVLGKNAPDAETFADLLGKVTERQDLAIASGSFRNDVGTQFDLVTEKALGDLLGARFGFDDLGGVHHINGRLVAARLKRGMGPSSWVLLDADNPPGMPDSFCAMPLTERLEAFEDVLPGISTCTRIELRSSSSRVRRKDEQPKPPTHAWIQVSDKTKIETLRAHVPVRTALHDLSFTSPRYSRSQPGVQIGSSQRTLFDTCVWDHGRLVFCAAPKMDESLRTEYKVDPAGVEIINPDGGLLDLSAVCVPTSTELREYSNKTGSRLTASVSSNGGLSMTSYSELTWETPIELEDGSEETFGDIFAKLLKAPGTKQRCQTPFRESFSMAAFVAIDGRGIPFLHDVGTATTYRIGPPRDARIDAAALMDPQVRAEVDAQRLEALEDFNSQNGLVRIEGKALVVRVGNDAIGNAGFTFCDIASERNMHANRLIPQYKPIFSHAVIVGYKLLSVPLFDVWLKWSERREYDGITFNPKPGAPTVSELPPDRGPLDIFAGYGFQPAAGECDMILEHIRTVWCGGIREGYDYAIKWLARMVQYPGKQAMTVLVLRGAEGGGKGTITNIFLRYFGRHAYELTNSRDLEGFNDHYATGIFLSANELIWGGDKSKEGPLKAMITDPVISVERKFVPAYQVRNCLHIIASSNADWVAPVGVSDRRYVMLDMSDHRIGDQQYFAELHREIESGGDRALIDYLLGVDLGKFNPAQMPPTNQAFKVSQKMRGASAEVRFISNILEHGAVTGRDLGVSVSLPINEGRDIPCKDLYESYERDGSSRHKVPATVFGKTLLSVLPSVKKVKVGPKCARAYHYRFPSLAVAKQDFARFLDANVDDVFPGGEEGEGEDEDEDDDFM